MKTILILLASYIALMMIYADITAKPAVAVQTAYGYPTNFVYATNSDFTNIFNGNVAMLAGAEVLDLAGSGTNRITVTNANCLFYKGAIIPFLGPEDQKRIYDNPAYRPLFKRATITFSLTP